MLPAKYSKFYEDLRHVIPESRLIIDPLRTLAYGTDASFYRLLPKIVIKAHTESEVTKLLSHSGLPGPAFAAKPSPIRSW